VAASWERAEDGIMPVMTKRRMVRTWVGTRSEAGDAVPDALPATEAGGVVSRVPLKAMSGGQSSCPPAAAGPPPCWFTATAGPRGSCSPPKRSRRAALGDEDRMAGMLGGDAVSPRM
jgi:hypothetical protein